MSYRNCGNQFDVNLYLRYLRVRRPLEFETRRACDQKLITNVKIILTSVNAHRCVFMLELNKFVCIKSVSSFCWLFPAIWVTTKKTRLQILRCVSAVASMGVKISVGTASSTKRPRAAKGRPPIDGCSMCYPREHFLIIDLAHSGELTIIIYNW